MRFEFTPGAQRALVAAAAWISHADSDDLAPPEVLLGLLAEPECRAALLLLARGIDERAVTERFSSLAPVASPVADRWAQFSPEWTACLNAAERLLLEYPRPLILATEHLLLGLAAGRSEVSIWLAERGLKAAELEAEVHRLSGHQPGPLPWDEVDSAPLDVADENNHDETVVEVDPQAGADSDTPPRDRLGVWRVLDAAANRAGEGLRVVEDYLRFVLDDRHLTTECKSIRHDLTAVLNRFSTADRHAARETRADVGTQIVVSAEQSRDEVGAVLVASFKRVEQALRSLEEFAKTLSPQAGRQLEALRYRVYTLERAVDITRTSVERLKDARLYVLIEGRSSAAEFRALVSSLIEANVDVLQLRDKVLPDRELLARARLLRELTAGTRTLMIVNDRPDLAALSRADGVHVGQEELSVKDARSIVGTRALVGLSTHSLEQARRAVWEGADYIGVGPTFPSRTKAFDSFTGLELLRGVAAEIRLPAFAIGGIDPHNLPQVLSAGFRRIAVSGAVTSAADPAAAARRLLTLLNQSGA